MFENVFSVPEITSSFLKVFVACFAADVAVCVPCLQQKRENVCLLIELD